MRILLVDDHPLVRAGIRTLLEGLERVTIVAEACGGRDAVRLAKEHAVDVVIMDITMRDLNGIDATKLIVAHNPAIRVLILSMHSTEEFVRQALRVGASGYLVKSAAPTELRLAVEALARGDTYLCSRVSGFLVSALGPADVAEGKESLLLSLTPRQREVLCLVAEGLSTKEIAATLDLSAKTVETHRAALMARLGIFDIAGLVKFAVRNNLISIDEPAP